MLTDVPCHSILTHKQAYEVLLKCRLNNKSPLSFPIYKSEISKVLQISFSEEKHYSSFKKLKHLHTKYGRIPINRMNDNPVWEEILYDPMMTDSIIVEEQPETSLEPVKITLPTAKRKKLLSLSKKQHHRRTDELYELLLKTAEAEGVSPTQLAGTSKSTFIS